MIAGKGVIIPGSNISGNTLYFDSMEDFPLVGQANTLYVDKTRYFIYLWQGEGYETADFNIPSPPQPPEPTTLFFESKEDFPGTGETDKVYISKDNGISWTWNATHEKYIDSEGRTGVYKALLSQSGTDAPVATVLENTLGYIPIFTYTAPGVYLSAEFTVESYFKEKVLVTISTPEGSDGIITNVRGSLYEDGTLVITSFKNNVKSNDVLSGIEDGVNGYTRTSITIEVYP